MSDTAFPPRRTPEGEKHDRQFIDLLEAMLRDDETITARALARRLEGLDHASSITRDPWRKARVAEWQARQNDMRRLMEQANKQSKSNLAATLERKDARIRELEERVALLTASHRAMIRAVGEGGMQAWLRFFADYQPLLDRLRDMGAMPTAPVAILPVAGQEGTDVKG
jgi:hypothetical protein